MVTISVLDTATQAQFDDVCRLLEQLHTGSSSSYRPDSGRFQEMVADPNIAFVVGRDGEKIIAMALLYTLKRVDETSGCVDDVIVDDAYRGQGIATRLMEHVISVAKERHLKHIDLTSRPSREAANHLYQKVGFVQRETNPYRLKL